MGEGTDRVTPSDGPQRPQVHQIAGEIDTLRGQLGEIVAELDRRRHELFDVRLQLRRHPVAAGVAVVTIAAGVGGIIAYAVWKQRQRERPMERAREMRRAFGRLLDAPHRVAREPSIGAKIAIAAGTAAATALTKRLVERAFQAPRPAA